MTNISLITEIIKINDEPNKSVWFMEEAKLQSIREQNRPSSESCEWGLQTPI